MTHSVVSARESVEGSNSIPCWRIEVRGEDGSQAEYIFPKSTLEWRAAEYGIDPNDVDELLHVILHEPHLTEPEEQGGAIKGGPTLWRASSTQQAHIAHMQRIKDCPVGIDVTGSKHLDVIRHKHGIDPARVRELAAHVDTHRWERRYGGLPKPPRENR